LERLSGPNDPLPLKCPQTPETFLCLDKALFCSLRAKNGQFQPIP
jgi:hypothetical protein